jgi:hypothetical protein
MQNVLVQGSSDTAIVPKIYYQVCELAKHQSLYVSDNSNGNCNNDFCNNNGTNDKKELN